jgi:predicted Zn-dependent protease
MPLFGYGNDGGGGRGFNLRWVIAMFIAGAGLVSYLMTRQVNPTTGEVQHVAMTESQEMALGLQSAPEMAAQMGGAAPKNDPDAQTVAKVGAQLVAGSPAGKSPYAQNFNFYLLNDRQTVNAFALPGGQIFITRALYDRLENEAQLAGVLGHEIGHVVHRHSAQQMAKANLGGALATAAGVGSNDARVAAGAQIAKQMLQLKYGRTDESQSDSTGVEYMVDAGFDPRGMLSVMEVLKKVSGGGRQPEWMSSHPDPGNRYEAIQQIIQQKYDKATLAKLSTGQALRGGERKPTDKW